MVPVYLDIPITGALCGLILDVTLLWMVGQISALKPGFKRLLLGGVVGGGYHFLWLMNQASDGLLYNWATSPWLFLLLPLPMVGLTFYPVKVPKFMGILGNFYLLAFLLTGINWGIDSLNQRFFGFEFSFGWRFLIHLTLVFILGEIGWGVVHRKIWEQTCLYPVRIEWAGNSLETTALLDTGNRLQDPLTKAPVVILELEVIKPYLPEKVMAMMAKLQQGEMDLHFEVAEYWQERLRILPFNTIGQDHGILVGFRPDRVIVGQAEREMCSSNAVVGLYNRTLSGEGTFHALFPPELIRE